MRRGLWQRCGPSLAATPCDVRNLQKGATVAEVKVLPNLGAVAEEAARYWVQVARAAVEERGVFRIALTGGEAARRLYEIMASEPYVNQAPWAQTAIFWSDERRVPPSHPESLYHLARTTLLDRVPIPREHIFRMDGEGLARMAASAYEETLQRHFKLGRGEWPRFDLVLLDMGADGHIASIFPGTRAVSDLTNMVVVYQVPQLRAERITLTLPVFNHARHVLIFATGAEKAATLAAVLHGPHRPSTYPAQAIHPVEGSLIWLADEDAAAQLPK